MYYMRAAMNGSIEGTMKAADCVYKGIDELDDSNFGITQLIKCLHSAIAAGHIEAEVRLGDILLQGKGVTPDPIEAFQCYERAAAAGYAKAYVLLGDCYFGGKGIAQSYETALIWYHKAIDNRQLIKDLAYVYKRLSECYKNGLGTDVSEKEALKYQLLSQKQQVKETPIVIPPPAQPNEQLKNELLESLIGIINRLLDKKRKDEEKPLEPDSSSVRNEKTVSPLLVPAPIQPDPPEPNDWWLYLLWGAIILLVIFFIIVK